jgi:hypothetical protein
VGEGGHEGRRLGCGYWQRWAAAYNTIAGWIAAASWIICIKMYSSSFLAVAEQ